MNSHKSKSGQNIIFVDHSSSAIGTSIYQSSANPDNLASIMRNNVIVIKTTQIEAGNEENIEFLQPKQNK